MFLLDDVVVYSPTDLAVAAVCEFAALRRLDVVLHRAGGVTTADPMLERAAVLGDQHEARVLDSFRHEFPGHGDHLGVVEIQDSTPYDRVTLELRRDETLTALWGGADVVYQGSFFDGRFHGRSDFLVRCGEAYAVYDTKLARHAKIVALLQLAAYADQLLAAGVAVDPQVTLILGDNSQSRHAVAELLAVYRDRRGRLEALLDAHHGQAAPVAWGDDRYGACGRCEVCAAEVTTSRDVLLVAGLRLSQRARLRAVGIATIEALAGSTGPVERLPRASLDRLREQAALQIGQELRPLDRSGRPDVSAVVVDAAALTRLPGADPGDIFFDFEGDPLWAEQGSPDWGLEYLFGVVEADTELFVPFWAHDRAQEKRALQQFLSYLRERQAAHPGMHVYHYAPYERTALLRLAGRHGVGEHVIDDLMRGGVFVDLYATVRQGIRVSQPSYSLKALEPLYMGEDVRSGVDNAAESIVAYARACAMLEDGRTEEHEQLLAQIAEYNAYDCRSTLRLRDWLLAQAPLGGRAPASEPGLPREPGSVELRLQETLSIEASLLELAGEEPRAARTPDQQTYALLAASLGYHRREDKPYWWAHFDRLRSPVDEWIGARESFLPDSVTVVTGWQLPAGKRVERRVLRLVGRLPEGSSLRQAQRAGTIYDSPVPDGMVVPADGCRAGGGEVEVRSHQVDDNGDDVLEVVERRRRGVAAFEQVPLALGPLAPPPVGSIEVALREVATAVLAAGLTDGPGPDVGKPGVELLRRRPPRMSGARPDLGSDPVVAVTAAVRALDGSYLAVQGPPGTGKTYLGARVVAALVASGWRIGVVAQSHAVIGHFLDRVVAAGVPAGQVGKKAHGAPGSWTPLPDKDYADFLVSHAESGCVLGGTAWDFTNLARVGRGELDLLVVDEAGQFSLANTIAVSVATQRLLLLGDPQQLPQVSQGAHPEPVDGSALGWLAEGHEALPEERGYFLDRTWRMHPRLCERVSRLSYAGRLFSQESVTAAREVVGLEPGIHLVEVDHQGNAVASPEEAAEVVHRVRALVDLPWRDGADPSQQGPLGQHGVMVVAAFNAQVELIRRALRGAGLGEVPVGTVDKFQGQQAPVVILSMAASSPEDVSRGMGFLLSRNRINVAVSRAEFATIVIRSPHLTDYLPSTPENLAELGAFLSLTSPVLGDIGVSAGRAERSISRAGSAAAPAGVPPRRGRPG